MIDEMWGIIEKRAQTDTRYDAPKRWRERTFSGRREICEVELGGRTYGVKGIRIEDGWWGREVTIVGHDDLYYSGLNTDNLCTLLTALRRHRYRKAA